MGAIVLKPQYTVQLENEKFKVVFDTNINETKRGIKMQFIPINKDIDIRMLSDVATKIGTLLQRKFTDYNILVERDTQVKNPLVIGFMIPLKSISDFVMLKVIKGN